MTLTRSLARAACGMIGVLMIAGCTREERLLSPCHQNVRPLDELNAQQRDALEARLSAAGCFLVNPPNDDVLKFGLPLCEAECTLRISPIQAVERWRPPGFMTFGSGMVVARIDMVQGTSRFLRLNPGDHAYWWVGRVIGSKQSRFYAVRPATAGQSVRFDYAANGSFEIDSKLPHPPGPPTHARWILPGTPVEEPPRTGLLLLSSRSDTLQVDTKVSELSWVSCEGGCCTSTRVQAQ